MDYQLRIKELKAENKALRDKIYGMTHDFLEWDIDVVKYEAGEVDEIDVYLMLEKVDNLPVLRSMYIELFRGLKSGLDLIERQRQAIETATNLMNGNG